MDNLPMDGPSNDRLPMNRPPMYTRIISGLEVIKVTDLKVQRLVISVFLPRVIQVQDPQDPQDCLCRACFVHDVFAVI